MEKSASDGEVMGQVDDEPGGRQPGHGDLEAVEHDHRGHHRGQVENASKYRRADERPMRSRS